MKKEAIGWHWRYDRTPWLDFGFLAREDEDGDDDETDVTMNSPPFHPSKINRSKEMRETLCFLPALPFDYYWLWVSRLAKFARRADRRT